MTRRAPSPAPHIAVEGLALRDHLMVEAARAYEQHEPVDATEAETTARESSGDFAHRLSVRSSGLPVAKALDAALGNIRRSSRTVVAVGCVLALMAGAGAARAALGHSERPVNFFWALAALLGVQLLLLVAWGVLMVRGPGAMSAGSLGGAALAGGRWLAGRLYRGPAQFAAIEATGQVFARGATARWTLGTVTHAMWTFFNVGCLVLVVFLLGARRYTFVWETTILSEDTYVPLTRALAVLPDAMGFSSPDDEQIRQSQWRGDDQPPPPEDAQGNWSGLLVGSLFAYGLGPRVALLGLCLLRRRVALRRLRLDLARPEYIWLRPVLMPETVSLGVVDPEDETRAIRAPEVGSPRTARPPGPPAIVGVEIERPAGPWPPPVGAVAWNDLGFVDTRDDQRRVLGAIETAEREPGPLVAVCALTSTPDRGLAAFLRGLSERVDAAPLLVLHGGQALRARGDGHHLEQRVADWRALAEAAGFEANRVEEIDLDHLTDMSRAVLAGLLGVEPVVAAATRRLDDAFDLIAEHAHRAGPAADPAAGAELHRAIAKLYGNQAEGWRATLGLPSSLGADVLGQLRDGADRMIDLLPPRLKASPKWIGAGAVAGALSCVAAATLLTPVAIASLPMWAAIGAALGAIAQRTPRDPEETREPGDVGEFVRPAALFALLLELQGREERTISRVLDESIGPDDSAALRSVEAARRWLDDVRHRFDLSTAGGGGMP